MNKDLHLMKCGGCGESCTEILRDNNKPFRELYARCCKCQSITIIKVASQIRLDWGDDAIGILE